ncbi:hypothetical protein AC1031_014355 [Aphanomyces cochlioides]|nr:hypothetical protein AC1031_014355 [Aphanomyces cochlioides]
MAFMFQFASMLTSLRSFLLLGLLATLCLAGSIFRSNPLDTQSFRLPAALDPLSELTPAKTSTLNLDDKKKAAIGVWQCESFRHGENTIPN